MSVTPLSIALVLLAIAGCAFAFWKGGPAERAGAGLILANLMLLWAGDRLLATISAGVFGLVIDGLTAAALLVVVMRYASLWLGGVMLLYALEFTLRAFYFVTERPFDLLHVIINNTDFIAVVFCLVTGTAVAWRRRARAAGA
jgi:hypothetical protein